MEKGFVYIGRLVDHYGNFVTNYHKIGKSVDFRTREINLNSTHMPLDVVFVRVFETQLMSNLEKILHACYMDQRVTKEYEWRRNITTEWFEVHDEESLEVKINTIIKNFPNTKEVDLISKIKSESGTTIGEKSEMINAVKKAKTSLQLFINGEECTGINAKETLKNACVYASQKVGWEALDRDENYITNNINEFQEKYNHNFNYATQDGYFILTSIGNGDKHKMIQSIIKRYNLTEMESIFKYGI